MEREPGFEHVVIGFGTPVRIYELCIEARRMARLRLPVGVTVGVKRRAG